MQKISYNIILLRHDIWGSDFMVNEVISWESWDFRLKFHFFLFVQTFDEELLDTCCYYNMLEYITNVIFLHHLCLL